MSLSWPSDVVKSGIGVAAHRARPRAADPARHHRHPLRLLQASCASALSAHALSVTPGELVIGIDDDGMMYTHCLDATHSAEYTAQAQAMRRDLLSKIFV